MSFLIDYLKSRGSSSVSVCTLLNKPARRKVNFELLGDGKFYCGFEVGLLVSLCICVAEYAWAYLSILLTSSVLSFYDPLKWFLLLHVRYKLSTCSLLHPKKSRKRKET